MNTPPEPELLEGSFPEPYGAPPMAKRASKLTVVLIAVGLAVLSTACRSPREPHLITAQQRRSVEGGRVSDGKPSPPQVASEPVSHLFLARVPAGALGPRLIETKRGHVAVWGVPNGESPGLYSVFVPSGGSPSDPRFLAPLASSSRQLQLGLNAAGGVLVSTVRRQGAADALSVLTLGAQGELVSPEALLAEAQTGILFTKVVPTARGAVAFWVERSGSSADLHSVVLDKKGPRREATIVRGISAWQIERSSAGLSVVTREGLARGAVRLRQLGDDGRVIGAPIELARDVTGGLDLDLAMTEKRIVVAWSEEGAFETRIVGATLDTSGNLLAPAAPLTHPRGPQTLVKLLGSSTGDSVSVVWEEPVRRAHERPSLFFGDLNSRTRLVDAEHALVSARKDALLPLFSRAPEGLAFITDSGACHEPGRSGPQACVSVQMGRYGGIVGPGAHRQIDLRLEDGTPASMAWDLSCAKKGCALLVADQSTPTRVFLSSLSGGPQAQGVSIPVGDQAPRITSNEPIRQIPELTKLVGQAGGTPDAPTELLSWLSYFDPQLPYVVPSEPAPDGRRAPVRALLSSEAVSGPAGGARTESTVISYRARSLGGLSLVAPRESRGLVAWAAVDGADPQLFATLVDARGVKLRQKMLTRTSGEVSDVAAVRVSDGYLLAWVDGRGATSEVYALHVSDALVPRGAPRQVSRGALTPTGVDLLVAGDHVFCVWSDPRGATATGHSDLYLASLEPATGEPLAEERKLTNSRGHLHSPRLSSGGQRGAELTWIVSGSGEGDVADGHLMTATLDHEGRLAAPARELSVGGSVADFSYECAAARCRGLAVVTSGGRGAESRTSLWAVVWGGTSQEVSRSVLPLWSRAPEGVSPVVVGDRVYFADREPGSEEWLLRRGVIDWGE